jgi:hypothetical protein
MFSPLTNLLVKIFVAGFYRAHSGMLFFLFGTIISYCFFINTLGSVPLWAFAKWNLAITLALVSDPFVLLGFVLVCLVYAVKSLQYNTGQLTLKKNEFLYYSSSSVDKVQQFRSWVVVQFNIFLPLWVYGLFAAIIGIYYGHYLLPACIFTYLLVLTCATTLIYLRVVNRLTDVNKVSRFMWLIKGWNKPFFLLYTFHVFNELKLAYMITKIVSLIFISGMVSLFSDQRDGTIIPAILMLVLVTTHSILIFNDYRFTETSLYFSHNFPYSKIELFMGFSTNYLILLLPELLWFIWSYSLITAVGIICMGLSYLLLFRSLLYWFGLDIKIFLFSVFVLFNIFFILILYNATWYLAPTNLLVAYLIFSENYLNQSLKF